MSDESVSVVGRVATTPDPPAVGFVPKQQSERPGVPLWAKVLVMGGAVTYCIGIPYAMFKLMQLIIHLI